MLENLKAVIYEVAANFCREQWAMIYLPVATSLF